MKTIVATLAFIWSQVFIHMTNLSQIFFILLAALLASSLHCPKLPKTSINAGSKNAQTTGCSPHVFNLSNEVLIWNLRWSCAVVFLRSVPNTEIRVWCHTRASETDLDCKETQTPPLCIQWWENVNEDEKVESRLGYLLVREDDTHECHVVS